MSSYNNLTLEELRSLVEATDKYECPMCKDEITRYVLSGGARLLAPCNHYKGWALFNSVHAEDGVYEEGSVELYLNNLGIKTL